MTTSFEGQPNTQPGGGPTLGRPTALKPRLESIPHELKEISNWVLWRYEPPKNPNGKWRKVPYQVNGKPASTTNRHTWSTFAACRAIYELGGYDGVGFVFDGKVGPDGTCLVGIDLDRCVDTVKSKIQHFAMERIKRLDTYTEASPSGTGLHMIARTELVESVKTKDVEIYTTARYFTFTGRRWDEGSPIRIATAEVRALVAELEVKRAAEWPSKPTAALFNGVKVAKAFEHLVVKPLVEESGPTEYWYDGLSPEQKDEVIEYALSVVTNKTPLFEIEEDGGNNDQWYRVTIAVARSGAPNAEDIFVKYASKANNPDPEDALREHFARCQNDPPPKSRGITVGTLLGLARELGADFEPWRHLQQEPLSTATWNPAELKVSFSSIPHRQWVYGTYLIRGEVTIVASPGGVGKTALATGMAIEISTGLELLEERIWGTELKVLSFNGEDGTDEMNRRMWAFSRAHIQQTGEQAPDRLYVVGTDDARVQQLSFLWTDARNTSHLNDIGFKVLESALDAVRPDVLMLDPLVAFCAGGNMNDNSVMALVMRELKRLAVKFNCAILVVHHTKKGGERGDQEAVSGAAAIVNLGRRALMPVPMTADEATALGVFPSERFRYFKLVDAKTNLTPRSADSPWYALHSIELPNAEPPTYPHGDNVQAVVRVTLPLPKTAVEAADDRKIQKAVLDLVDRGKLIDGERHPYSPNITGAKNLRGLLDDASAAVAGATARQWRPDDLRAVIHAATDKMKVEGWLYEEKLKTKRFHGSWALYVNWAKTPWSTPASPVGDGTASGEEPAGEDEVYDDEFDRELAKLLAAKE